MDFSSTGAEIRSLPVSTYAGRESASRQTDVGIETWIQDTSLTQYDKALLV